MNWIYFRVDDAEDGSTTNLEGKIIDCQKVEVQPGLGHQQHVHSYLTSKGCSGKDEVILSILRTKYIFQTIFH
jgi:hypothetical protein